MAVWKLSRLLVLVTCAALGLAPTRSVTQEPGWRQAVERLAQEKIMAQGCAAILKSFADHDPMARVQGQRLYAGKS